jgi:cellulose biosynthesis protein BcsQ
MKTKIFNTKISVSIKVKEAQGMKTPLRLFAPECKPYKEYNELTNEIIKEINNYE